MILREIQAIHGGEIIMFRCDYDGCKIEMEFSAHALKRINQRGLNQTAVFGSIVAALDFILDLKDGEEFVVVDKEARCTSVAGMKFEGDVLCIDIITVIDTQYTYTKVGQKMIKI